jgi:hypothetical protein
LFFNNNYIFLDFNNLENSNKNILKKIKLINKTKNKISLEIRNNLNLLFIILFNKKQNFNLFDSFINSFFIYINIKSKNQLFINILDLNKYYSYFIYNS